MKGDYSNIKSEEGFSEEKAKSIAAKDGLMLNKSHIDVLRALYSYYEKHEPKRINLRELHDALDERFHHQGGMKYLYNLFPGGPVAQGCRIAGLQPPSGAEDKGFGSVA